MFESLSMWLKKKFQELYKSPFVEGFLKIFSGTFAGQLVTIVSIFVLANLYSTESFGQLEIVASSSAVIASLVGMRYEMALMLPRFRKVSVNIYLLSLLISLLIVAILTILSFGINAIFGLISNSLILLSLLGGYGFFLINCAVLWNNRKEKFSQTAYINVTKAVAVAAIQFMLIKYSIGLAVGYSLGMILSGFYFNGYIFFREKLWNYLSIRLLFYSFKRYLRFSLYSIPGSFINTVSAALPAYFIPLIFSKHELGLFSLLKKIVLGPLHLIAGSLNNVVYQQFTKKIAHGNSVLPAFKRIIKNMSFVGLAAVIGLVGLLQLGFFDFFLGEEWSSLEKLLYLFLPALFFGFLAKSVSKFAIFERTDIGFYFQLTLLISTCLVFIAAWQLMWTFDTTILAFSVLQAIIFILQLLLSYQLSRKT